MIRTHQEPIQQEGDMTADEASHKDAPGRVHLKASDYDTDFYWSVDQVLDPDIWPYAPGSAGRGSPSPQLGPEPQPDPGLLGHDHHRDPPKGPHGTPQFNH
jgi:hypothetical protein